MTTAANPYDELPYRSAPIEWTACGTAGGGVASARRTAAITG